MAQLRSACFLPADVMERPLTNSPHPCSHMIDLWTPWWLSTEAREAGEAQTRLPCAKTLTAAAEANFGFPLRLSAARVTRRSLSGPMAPPFCKKSRTALGQRRSGPRLPIKLPLPLVLRRWGRTSGTSLLTGSRGRRRCRCRLSARSCPPPLRRHFGGTPLTCWVR